MYRFFVCARRIVFDLKGLLVRTAYIMKSDIVCLISHCCKFVDLLLINNKYFFYFEKIKSIIKKKGL